MTGQPCAHSVAPPLNATGTVPHILVVDDNRVMLGLMADVLQPQGLRVYTAENGYRAIETLRSDGAISVVILDWQMPCMSGEHVLDQLVAIRPGIQAIVSSSGDASEVRRAFAGRDVLRFLQKPFQIQAMVAAVKSALPASG